jgi:hypothetical protein
MTATRKYEFIVEDSDGLWGSMRDEGVSQEDAEQRIRYWLETREVHPQGSLLPDFTLRFSQMLTDQE